MLGVPVVKKRYLDRTTDIRAKVMFIVERTPIAIRLQSWALGIPRRRIEYPVATVLERRTMVSSPARLADHRDLPRRGRPILRSVVRRENLHLLHHVRRHLKIALDGHHAALAHETFLHGCAVEKCLVARLQPTIDAGIERLIAAAG